MNRVREIPSPRPGRAFTLVELVAVMTVAAVLAAAALPALAPTRASRVALAARRVAADLRFAGEWAMLSGRTAWVEVEPPADRYSIRLERADLPGRAHAMPYEDPSTGRPHTQSFRGGDYPGVGIEGASFGGGLVLGLTRDGVPRRADGTRLIAPGVVTLTGGAEVRVEPLTGHVEVMP